MCMHELQYKNQLVVLIYQAFTWDYIRYYSGSNNIQMVIGNSIWWSFQKKIIHRLLYVFIVFALKMRYKTLFQFEIVDILLCTQLFRQIFIFELCILKWYNFYSFHMIQLIKFIVMKKGMGSWEKAHQIVKNYLIDSNFTGTFRKNQWYLCKKLITKNQISIQWRPFNMMRHHDGC